MVLKTKTVIYVITSCILIIGKDEISGRVKKGLGNLTLTGHIECNKGWGEEWVTYL